MQDCRCGSGLGGPRSCCGYGDGAGVVGAAVIPARGRQRQKYRYEFETGLGYVARPTFRIKTTKRNSKDRRRGELETRRQEDSCEFHTSLGCVARPCLKNSR